MKLINRLEHYGLCFKNDKKKITDVVTFFITGTLPIPRKELEALIKSKGGLLKHTYSKNIDYFIVGEKPSDAKLSKAKNNNLKIINYDKFKKIINSFN